MHTQFVGCHNDVDSLQSSTSTLVEVYATQLVKDRSYLTGDHPLKESDRVYLDAVTNGIVK